MAIPFDRIDRISLDLGLPVSGEELSIRRTERDVPEGSDVLDVTATGTDGATITVTLRARDLRHILDGMGV